MMDRRFLSLLVAAVVLLGFTGEMAQAHPGHPHPEQPGGFHAGWWHPFLGLDHLLAMVAVGLLAVRMGGHGLWLMPATFLASMLLGGVAAAAGVPLPAVEIGIMASVFILGLLIAASRFAPLGLGVLLVTLFAYFHGYAHAAEMTAGGALAPYAVGFLLATALLHAAGIAGGVSLKHVRRIDPFRYVGGAIAAAGLLMLVGWM